MTIKVREWKRGKHVGFEVDIRLTYPDGTPFRQRIKAPVESRSAARRWGEARERELLTKPSPSVQKQQTLEHQEVPTLREFGPRYIENHGKADRPKASTVDWIEQTYRNHLYPELGDKQLDAIDDEDVQRLKARLAQRNRKTVNNVLGVPAHTLKTAAARWKVVAQVPCTLAMLKVSRALPKFYDFGDYRVLTASARAVDVRAHLIVLLGRGRGSTPRRNAGAAVGRHRLQATPASGGGGRLGAQTARRHGPRPHRRHAQGRPVARRGA
jgi:hypothetical protein